MRVETAIKVPWRSLPEPLRGVDPDSFAKYTISERLPDIARRVLSESDWSPESESRLQALIAEMPQAGLRTLEDEQAPDASEWKRYIAPYLEWDWLKPPWFLVETYFFRRVLEATGYYHLDESQRVDPYAPQKRLGLDTVHENMLPFCALLDTLRLNRTKDQAALQSALTQLLRMSIWGNQADLSLWPAGENAQPYGPDRPDMPDSEMLTAYLLADHAPAASRYLTHQETPAQVDFILDNGGIELAYDLGLADFLLSNQIAWRVNFQAKSHPTYVSDATIQDVLDMVSYLASAPDPRVSDLSVRLKGYLVDGALQLKDHYYWTSPLSGWDMPVDLRQELGKTDLIVSKGDANYRRWMGDLHWPFTTPLQDVLHYLPSPWLALRVFKSNVMVGMDIRKQREMDRDDPRWMYNGKWGLIQFVI